MRTIRLKVHGATSEIRVGGGCFKGLGAELASAGLGGPLLLVSQEKVLRAVGKPRLGRTPVVTIPDGERAKTLGTVRRLIDAMLEHGLGRDATVVALGGGVVGDVTGFAASIYLRGVAVVQVPTTLLAQVDSSVGGKTGVNHTLGKNLIGTFHQPRMVLADPELLGSLPAREYRSGLYEALKYGVIRDRTLFGKFEKSSGRLLQRDAALLDDLVYRCLKIKATVVSADEKEEGLRRILNFGHTVGHAIEAASGYRKIAHGEAVGHGMLAATRIAEEEGILVKEEASRIVEAVQALGSLPSVGALSVGEMLRSMRHDKKVQDGALHFVLPERIGRVRVVAGISPARVRRAIRGLA